MEPADQFYGDHTHMAEDLEGHHWTFGQPVNDLPAFALAIHDARLHRPATAARPVAGPNVIDVSRLQAHRTMIPAIQ